MTGELTNPLKSFFLKSRKWSNTDHSSSSRHATCTDFPHLSLSLPRHPSLSSIVSGRSSKLRSVFVHLHVRMRGFTVERHL